MPAVGGSGRLRAQNGTVVPIWLGWARMSCLIAASAGAALRGHVGRHLGRTPELRTVLARLVSARMRHAGRGERLRCIQRLCGRRARFPAAHCCCGRRVLAPAVTKAFLPQAMVFSAGIRLLVAPPALAQRLRARLLAAGVAVPPASQAPRAHQDELMAASALEQPHPQRHRLPAQEPDEELDKAGNLYDNNDYCVVGDRFSG